MLFNASIGISILPTAYLWGCLPPFIQQRVSTGNYDRIPNNLAIVPRKEHALITVSRYIICLLENEMSSVRTYALLLILEKHSSLVVEIYFRKNIMNCRKIIIVFPFVKLLNSKKVL